MPVITQPAPLPRTGTVAASNQPPPTAPAAPQPEAPVTAAPTPDAPAAVDPKVLAKYERERRQYQEQARQYKAQLDAQAAEQQKKFVSIDRLRTDALGVLGEQGITYDQLVQAALNQPTPEQQQIQALQKKLEAFEASQVQNQDASYKQAVAQIKSDATKLIDNNPQYETIKAQRAHDAVVSLIEQTYKADGTLLSVEEASEQVENYLVEEAIKLASLPKIRAKLNPAQLSTEQPAMPGKPTLTNQPQIKTLTNAAMANSSKPRTAAERRARAIAIARGEVIS